MNFQQRASDAPASQEQITVIEPVTTWNARVLTDLWAYRHLLWVLTLRDIQVRYKQTVLGASWAIIQPVANMIIFSILLGRVAKLPSEGQPYPIFLYAGMLPWTYFAAAIGSSANSVVGSAHLVSKIYFPRIIIPFSSTLAHLIDLAVAGSVFVVLMVYYGLAPTWRVVLVPVLIAAVLATALGIGTFLAALNVAYRDFRYVVTFLIQIWMYATPVVYSVQLVPAKWHWLYFANPMAGVITAFRSSLLGQELLVPELALSLASAAAIFLLGAAYFNKVQSDFADVI